MRLKKGKPYNDPNNTTLFKRLFSGMNEIVNGAMREIQAAVSHVDEMSVENNRNFDELKAESGKFKVDSVDDKKKIIVIDDEETILTMTKSMLSKGNQQHTQGSSSDFYIFGRPEGQSSGAENGSSRFYKETHQKN